MNRSKKNRVIGSIEARMGSTRLPGKTLMEIWKGKSLLEIVIDRFRLCSLVDDVVVMTSTSMVDDQIVDFCLKKNVKCFRGSELNVLERVTSGAVEYNADAIVQMGADSAYLDFKVIDRLIEIFNENDCDYLANDFEIRLPLGIYAHIVKVKTLLEINNIPELSVQDKENVVSYLWTSSQYKKINVKHLEIYSAPNFRLTIDYPEDLLLAKSIYQKLDRIDFSLNDILELAKSNPHLFDVVSGLIQKSFPSLNPSNIITTINDSKMF